MIKRKKKSRTVEIEVLSVINFLERLKSHIRDFTKNSHRFLEKTLEKVKDEGNASKQEEGPGMDLAKTV